jgi:hypothetical protein
MNTASSPSLATLGANSNLQNDKVFCLFAFTFSN